VRAIFAHRERNHDRLAAIPRSQFLRRCALPSGILIGGVAALVWPSVARTPQATPAPDSDAALLEGFRHVEVASVSDALEQIAGRKMYMTHRMRPIFPTKFAGFAVTVLLKKDGSHDPNALTGMLAAIDHGGPNSVYVMVVEDGADIAGMGGLMGTAMASRNFSGAIVDGGVRDVAYLQKIAFPVYALGIVPSTSINHYRFAGANIPGSMRRSRGERPGHRGGRCGWCGRRSARLRHPGS